MALTMEQEDKLQHLINEIDENVKSLNEWETNFYNDVTERFHKYASNLSLTPKQWAALTRIHEKATEV